ncbi:MAG TPA: hypothetical protein VNO70_09835, partial [Blastocatellia bacterium]|nr:hypothetical protein [Blastocatellia bacterium]
MDESLALDNFAAALIQSAALSASEKSYLNAMADENDAPSNAAIDAFTDPAAVVRRVWRDIFAVIIIGIIIAAIFAGWRFLLG